jgi:ribosomal protein L11 methylase PrmA
MTYHFYSLQSKDITAIDFDEFAIKRARKNCNFENINYLVGDIRSDIPTGLYQNIIWDAAIEHFTEKEIKDLMGTIKSRLTESGILSGYTIKEDHDGAHHLHQHEYEFHNKEDLARFLKPHFAHVQVIETEFPNRTNLYFFASDGSLPLETTVSLIEK